MSRAGGPLDESRPRGTGAFRADHRAERAALSCASGGAQSNLKKMGSVKEIQEAVLRLSPADLTAFRAWFAELDADVWDRQIEDDAAAGRLDAMADEAIDDLRAGRCTDR